MRLLILYYGNYVLHQRNGNKIRTGILLTLLKGVNEKLIIVKEEVRDDI